MAGVIPPVPVTNGMLTSSTVAEPGVGETTWTSGATFAAGDKAILGSPTSTVTITVASPAVVSWASNGLPNDTPVVLTTTGALPTGLTAGQVYYIVNRAAGSFQLADEPGGGAITTTGSQSGTHTATAQVHRTYLSLIGSNTGNPPAIDDGTKWSDIGPTNRWACLDTMQGTKTWAASPYVFEITPGQRVDSIALLGMVAESVTIEIIRSAVVIQTETISLSTREVGSYMEFFFSPFTFKTKLLRLNIPPYTDATIKVTMTRSAGLVGLGACVIGRFVSLGKTQHGAKRGRRNFTRITRNDYGDASVTRRRSVPTKAETILFDKARTQRIDELGAELDGVPAVFTSLDEDDGGYFEPFLLLALATRWDIDAERAERGALQAEFEEV